MAQRAPQQCVGCSRAPGAVRTAPACLQHVAQLRAEPARWMQRSCATPSQRATGAVPPAYIAPARRIVQHPPAAAWPGMRGTSSLHASASDVHAFTDGGSDSSSGDGSSGADEGVPQTQQPADAEHSAAPAAGEEISSQEAQRRLKRAADLLGMVHLMAPSDPETFNRALVLW